MKEATTNKVNGGSSLGRQAIVIGCKYKARDIGLRSKL